MARSIDAICAVISLSAFAVACAPVDTINIRFRSEAISKSVREVKTFVFAAPDATDPASRPPSCAELDPRGLPPGDAPSRTGLVPQLSATGSPKDTVAEFSDLPKGHYTLVIEAWGPRCMKVAEAGGGANDDPACAIPATDSATVLRAYTCTALELGNGARTDLDIQMETFAAIGSVMRVPPMNATHYDAMNPLPVVDGVEARDRFVVQLLNSNGEADDDQKVRWAVSAGAGSFVGAQPAITGNDDTVADHGVASAVLRAGETASSIDGGKMTITAYAPGYEGSPIEFSVQALRGVALEVSSVLVPRSKVDLSGTDPEYRPVIADDFDGDGRTDVATVGGVQPPGCGGGEATHQLVVLYGKEDGGFQAAYSPPEEKEAIALASARIGADGRRVIIISVASWCSRYQDTPQGRTFVIQGPALELWSGLDELPLPNEDALRASRLVLTQTTHCSGLMCAPAPEALTKAAIAIDAKDIDGDGTDEIAMARCSYDYATSGGQYSRVRCHGDLSDRTDSELVLMTADVNGPRIDGLHERAAIGEQGGDGGFREVRLADISGDGSLDLVAATQTEVAVFCGSRNMPGTGYGFAQNPQRNDKPITFAQGFSVGVGRFNGDDQNDVLVTGGLRAASPNAGIKLNPGAGCGFGEGPEPIITGPRTDARFQLVRVTDLNHDGFDDALVLHRETRLLESYFGSGTNLLARGPTVSLPSSVNGELGLYVESPGEGQTAVAVTTGPTENAVFVVRIKPR